MGVTISKTALSPLSLLSITIGLISFAFTLATFLNVFWSSLQTLHAAPREITDFLSNLKQGLLEERRHLRRVGKRLRSARRGRSGSVSREDGKRRYSGGDGGGGGRRARFERDEQALRSDGETDSLKALRAAVRDMIQSFRAIEYPFLRPEFQQKNSTAQWSTNAQVEKPPFTNPAYSYPDDDEPEAQGLGGSNRFGNEYRTCGLRERWMWLRRKGDVVRMSEGLSRLETRRMAHEVGRATMMLRDIGRDLEDVWEGVGRLEGRLGRVVGVRRVEN
jgi:hypothetical protein